MKVNTNRYHHEAEGDRVTEIAIRATEITRIMASLSIELVELARDDDDETRRRAQKASVAAADAARDAGHLTDRYVDRARAIYDGTAALGTKAVSCCSRAVRTELQGLPTARTFNC